MAVTNSAWDGSASRFTPEQWARSCLVHLAAPDDPIKSNHKVPVKEPGGDINRAACHAAAAALAGGRGGVDAPPAKLKAAARELVSIYTNDLGEEPPESLTQLAGKGKGKGKGDEERIVEHKVFVPDGLTFKQNSGAGQIKGYCATYGNLDRQGDIIAPGAFDKSLPVFLRDGFIALSHDPHRLPIAIPVDAKSDDFGVMLTADFHSTPEAQDARTVAQERIAKGKSVAFSIGYAIPPGGSEYTNDGTRLLKEIDLMEVSLVTIPANPMAQVTGVKDNSLLAGLTFADHSDAVLATVCGFVDRAKGLWDLRTKEGRQFSAANRRKLAALMEHLDNIRADIQTLLDETAPASGVADQADQAEQEEGQAQIEAPKSRVIKRSTKKPGSAGTVGDYRRRLAEIEDWAYATGLGLRHIG